MSSQLKVDISLNAAGYNQGIEKATNATKEYTNQVTKISKDLPNLTKEMRAAQKETMNLTLAVARLTEEQRNSAEGQAMIRMLEESKQKAAELTDMLGDTRAQIRNMASDTLELDAARDAVSLLGNTFSSLQGTIALVTGDTDKMKRAVTAFTTVQSTLNAVTSIGNVIQKQSSLLTVLSTKYTNLKKIATNAATSAQIGNTAATNAGKVGQNSFNVALAVGKALLGDWKSLLVAAGVALGGYAAITAMTAEDTKKLEEEQKKAKQEEENLMKAQNQHDSMIRDKYATTVADLTSRFRELQRKWRECKTEAEKNELIKQAQQDFHDFGVAVNSVIDAENVLITNEEAMLKYFDSVGNAAAYAALKMESFKKAAQLQWDLEQKRKELSGQNTAGTEMAADYADRYNLQEGKDYRWKDPNGVHNKIILTAEGAAKVNEKVFKKSSEILDIEKQINEAKEEQAYWDGKITEEKTNQANILNGAGINPYTGGTSSSTSSSGGKGRNIDEPTQEEIQETANRISEEFKHKAADISIDYTPNQIKDKIKKLQTILDNTPVKINGQFNPERKKIKERIEYWKKELDPKESIIDEDEFNKSLEKGFDALIEKQRELDAIEAKIQENRIHRLDAISSVIGSTISMFKSLSSEFGDSVAVNIAAIMAESAANIALSYAKAMAEHKSFTIWDWIPAAAAGLAQMVSVIATMKSNVSGYAQGGVIGGNSYTGDNLIIRANSRERILTAKQNKALNEGLAQIDSLSQTGRLYGTVTVKGSDLNIAMSNFDKTRKKSR